MAAIPALTSTFTPPASCLTPIFRENAAIVLGDPRATTSCLPSGIDPLQTSYFSPGIDCPKGYTQACSNEVTAGTATETRATCCPVGGYTCKYQKDWFWPFDSSYGCSSHYATTETLKVTTSTSGNYVTTTNVMRGGYDYINAYSVQIRWQSNDLIRATASSNSGRSSSASPSSNTSSATSTSTSSSGSSGLSSGAKIGIGVGVGVGAALLLAGLLLFLFGRWRKRGSGPAEVDGTNSAYAYHPAKTQDPYHGSVGHSDPKYAPPPPPTELDGSSRPLEAPDTSR